MQMIRVTVRKGVETREVVDVKAVGRWLKVGSLETYDASTLKQTRASTYSGGASKRLERIPFVTIGAKPN